MKVLVDSDVWSGVFQRKKPIETRYTERLRMLIENDEACMIGLVRQEVLSGVREKAGFEKLRKLLRAFPDLPVTQDIHELAASFHNHCRVKGVQGSHADFLICACAVSWKMKILSLDGDYTHYVKYLPIEFDNP